MRSRVFWNVSGVSFIILGLSFGARQAFPVFYLPILETFGWSRAETSGGYATALLSGTFAAPFIGMFVDRYGSKISIIIGGVVFAISLITTGGIRELWQFYIVFGVLGSLGISFISIGVLVLLGNLFPKARGRAMGVAYSGIAVGQFLLVPASQFGIDAFGWRVTYAAIGTLSALIVPLAFFLPAVSTPTIQSEDATKKPGRIVSLKTPALILGAAYFCAGIADLALFQHSVPYLIHEGRSPNFAAWMLAGTCLGYLVGQVVGGALADVVSRRVSAAAAALLVIVGAGALLFGSEGLLVFLIPACFGTGVGAMINVRTTVANDVYSGPRLGRATGTLQLCAAAGASAITWYGGREFDVSGSYELTFYIAGIGAALWFLTIIAADIYVKRAG